MAVKKRYGKCESVEVYRWNGWRYVLVRTMTPEEAEAEDLAMREKAKKTQARRRRINKIVWENKFASYEEALDYVLNGGEATAEFLEYMEKDKGHWKQEIIFARDGQGTRKGWKNDGRE